MIYHSQNTLYNIVNIGKVTKHITVIKYLYRTMV